MSEVENHDPVKKKEIQGPVVPPWLLYARKFRGKKETDPSFSKFMVAKWRLVGLNYKTIAENWAAWCGLAMAVALAGAGLSYQHDGAGARNWDRYGIAINWRVDGIPAGAIVRINHDGNCAESKNNHVTESDGDCAPQDLLKPGATFLGYGGNQGNTWKTSSYPVKDICAVRWPGDYAKPPKITRSNGCSSGHAGQESTQ